MHTHYWLPFSSLVSFSLTSASMIFLGFPRWKILWNLWCHHFSPLACALSVWLKQMAVACNDKHSSPPSPPNDVSKEELPDGHSSAERHQTDACFQCRQRVNPCSDSVVSECRSDPVPVTPVSTAGWSGSTSEAQSYCRQPVIRQW